MRNSLRRRESVLSSNLALTIIPSERQLSDVLSEFARTSGGDVRSGMSFSESRLAASPVNNQRGITAKHPAIRTVAPFHRRVLIPLAEAPVTSLKSDDGYWDKRVSTVTAGREVRAMSHLSWRSTSPRSAHGPGFAATVADVVTRTNTMPQSLCIEITESALVQDGDRGLAVLTQLKQLGVAVALDDFGTGYSSLTHLKNFPVDVLKIDQSFIGDLTVDASSHGIVPKPGPTQTSLGVKRHFSDVSC